MTRYSGVMKLSDPDIFVAVLVKVISMQLVALFALVVTVLIVGAIIVGTSVDRQDKKLIRRR